MDDDGLIGLEHPIEVRHGRIEREEVVELERRRLAFSVSALSPRSATQSGSPTGITVASPSSAPRRIIVSMRGSRPSARANFGRCAQANSVPEASSNARREG
jgi:hypothetical protein